MKKRSIFTLLLLCFLSILILGVHVDESFAIEYLELPDADATYTFSGGDGTQGTPFEIDSAEEFAQFGANVNAGTPYADTFFVLTSDIDLGVYEAWIPIGIDGFTPAKRFQGTLDGQNHTISNFTVPYRSNYAGLFGILNNGTICNFELSGGMVTGRDMVGLAVGINYGTIHNISVVDSTVVGQYRVGGVVGDNGDLTYNCSSDSDTTVYGLQNVGGLAGTNRGGRLYNSYSFATIKKNEDILNVDYESIGGAAGLFEYSVWSDRYSVANVFSGGVVESAGGNYVGQVVGKNKITTITTDCYYNEDSPLNDSFGTGVSSEAFNNVGSPNQTLADILNQNLDESYLSDTRYLMWTQDEGDTPRFSTEYWVAPIAVASIEVKADKDVDTLAFGNTLQMSVVASPDEASDKTVSWSVENDSGQASIKASGLLSPEGIGIITVVAVSNADNKIKDSMEIRIIKGEQSAPSNLVGVAPTYLGYPDGKITGTTNKMEYSVDEIDWTSCSGNEISDLSPGTYYVRSMESEQYNSGEKATIVVPASNIAAPIATVEGTLGEDGWYVSTVNLMAPIGFTISSDNVNYDEKVTIDADAPSKVYGYYLKEIGGDFVSAQLQTDEIKIDTTSPFIHRITVTDVTAHSGLVTIQAQDDTSGIDKICYSMVRSTPQEIIQSGIETNGDIQLAGLDANTQQEVFLSVIDKAGNVLVNLGVESFRTLPETPTKPILDSKTDTVIQVSAVEGQEYSIDDGTTWQDGGTFAGLSQDTEYEITTRIKKDGENLASDSSLALIVVTKESGPLAPIAPTLEKNEGTTITVTTVEGQEYSIDGGSSWQESGAFANLTRNTTYSIITRIKGNEDSMPSDASEALMLTAMRSRSNSDEDEDSDADAGTDIIVNGEKQSAGDTITKIINSRRTTIVSVDDSRLNSIIKSKGKGVEVVIPITTDSSISKGLLDGQMVKDLENKEARLEVRTNDAVYTIYAAQIDIDGIAKKLGKDIALKDIKVEITIAEPSDATAKVVKHATSDEHYSIMVPAVDFTITCTYEKQTIEVHQFNTFVSRRVAIPTDVDQTKITTAIIVNSDESNYSVPTKIIEIDGQFYAEINSLTNSTYTLVYNPVAFDDINNHWAKDSINNMGSRIVVSGVGDNNFNPDSSITRAEIATIVVKALGLEKGIGEETFTDVSESDWFSEYVSTAVSYDLISGYGDATFRPQEKITREQVMAIVAKAMKITGIENALSEDDIANILSQYEDASSISSYAKSSVAACVNASIVGGRSETTLAPKDSISRAEVAVIIERLLQKSDLI